MSTKVTVGPTVKSYICMVNARDHRLKIQWELVGAGIACAPTPHMQAPTRPAAAPSGPHIHVQIVLAATLLLKCMLHCFVFLTVRMQN